MDKINEFVAYMEVLIDKAETVEELDMLIKVMEKVDLIIKELHFKKISFMAIDAWADR